VNPPGVEVASLPAISSASLRPHRAAFLVATVLGHVAPHLLPIAGTWALAVGFSRIYLGSITDDVVAGMLLGCLSALAGIVAAS